MGKALIIGCGGVASVAIHKCCQNSEVFEEICIASFRELQKQRSQPLRWMLTMWKSWWL